MEGKNIKQLDGPNLVYRICITLRCMRKNRLLSLGLFLQEFRTINTFQWGSFLPLGSTLIEFRHYEPILKDSNFLRTCVIHFSAKQPGQTRMCVVAVASCRVLLCLHRPNGVLVLKAVLPPLAMLDWSSLSLMWTVTFNLSVSF